MSTLVFLALMVWFGIAAGLLAAWVPMPWLPLVLVAIGVCLGLVVDDWLQRPERWA